MFLLYKIYIKYQKLDNPKYTRTYRIIKQIQSRITIRKINKNNQQKKQILNIQKHKSTPAIKYIVQNIKIYNKYAKKDDTNTKIHENTRIRSTKYTESTKYKNTKYTKKQKVRKK